MTLYQARKGGKRVNLLINDLGEDGYTLRLATPGVRIDEDVENILSSLA